MMNIIGFGKKPEGLQKNADLELKQKTLHQTLSVENSTAKLDVKLLNNLLSTIHQHSELTKGYLAALQGTAQRTSQSHSISRSELQTMMAQQSVILSEALEMIWNGNQILSELIQSLQIKKD